MHIRHSGRHHTAPARAAVAAAVGAALIVPLTGAVPGTSEPAETATGAPAATDRVSPTAAPTPTEEPSPEERSEEPSPDEDTVVKATSEYHGGAEGGWVRLIDVNEPGSTGIRESRPFDCTLGGLKRTCRIAEDGILAPGFGSKRIPLPAPGKAERYYFSKDPKIEMTITDGKPKITKIDQTARVSTSPFDEPSPSPTDVPTQGPTNDPTDEPSPEPTNAPPEDDPRGDDDPRRESDPSEDDRPEATAPPSSLEDPNSGNGRRSVRVPGQAGDDWAPTGDGNGQHPHDNYADPVPRAPDGDESAADDAISAEGSPGGLTDRPAETSADDDAADLASATGSAWAIGGLVGIAAVAIGLVVFILGRSRRRRAH